MDSIGEQLKPMMPDAETFGSIVQRLENEQAYKLFMDKYPDIDEETIRRNQSRLAQMCKEYKNCAVCMSLASCKNDLPQYQYALNVSETNDGWGITEVVRPCRKHKK